MICKHCLKRKPGPPSVCTCTVRSAHGIHLVCAACADPSNDTSPPSIAAANAAWLAPLSRMRIEHTNRLLADTVFLAEPWGNA